MRFLHAADIHLDSPLEGLERYESAPVELIRGATRRALENLVQLAIREQVDFVVIAGDLYDGDWRDFNTGMFFVRQMAQLREAGIPVYLIAGNHDAASTMTRKLRLPLNPGGDSMMLSHELAETRRLDDLGVAVHGRSFAQQAELKNLVPEYPTPVSNWFNIGILHTSLNGSSEHDTYAPCSPTDLKSKGYDYWALGHIHKRSWLPSDGTPLAAPPALYSGNIQGRHIRETGRRGCFIVSVNERHQVEVTFHPLDVFRWDVCTVSAANALTVDDLLEQFRQDLQPLLDRHPDLPQGIRVVFDGPSPAHQELISHRTAVTAEVRSIAAIRTESRVWIEQVRISTSYPRDVELAWHGEGPLGELTKFLEELPHDPQGLAAMADQLKDLARKLPGEVLQPPDGLQLDQLEWVLSAVQDIKPLLRDRLQK